MLQTTNRGGVDRASALVGDRQLTISRVVQIYYCRPRLRLLLGLKCTAVKLEKAIAGPK